MVSTDFIDATIANLKVISMVPKSGKLCVKRGCLCLDRLDHPQLQGVRRWINGDSRDLTILHAKNTLHSAMKICHLLMAAVHADAPTDPMSLWTIRRIYEELSACESGLQNLKTTYQSDSMTLANLDVVIERQQANRRELNTFLESIDGAAK